MLASHGERPASGDRGGYASPYESDPDHASIDIHPHMHDSMHGDMHEPVSTAAFESKVSPDVHFVLNNS